MMNYHTLPEIESYYCCGIWECSDAGELSTGHQQGAPGTSHEGETEDQGKPATPSNYIKVQPPSDKRGNSHWEKWLLIPLKKIKLKKKIISIKLCQKKLYVCLQLL